VHKFPIYNYKRCSELPYDDFDNFKFAIYIIDLDWNYLFANKFVFELHKLERSKLIGSNIGGSLQDKMQIDSQFKSFIKMVREGNSANITTISTISNKRVNVTGYPLEDCYYFAVTILPDKDDLMNELRTQLKK
jgi:hypothetical protein